MATVESVPPLVAGDRLTRAEFLRRWVEHPEIKKAELIGGTVYMPSPVAVEHGDTEGDVGGWLWFYKTHTPGTACGHNTTTFILEDCPQPDINLRILTEYGGKSWVHGRYLHGIPELFAEISRSSAAYDLHQKLELFQKAQVPEYLVILLHEREIRWHVLENDVYQLLAADADGVWRSHVFPGLWLDGQALLDGNLAQVLATLQSGIQSPEHRAFVEKLAGVKRGD
jgi:Uma2 family endonuclease